MRKVARIPAIAFLLTGSGIAGAQSPSSAVPGNPPPWPETEFKSWFLGICTSHYAVAQQADINTRRTLENALRDPARAGPILEQQLRKQVRYANGLLLIDDPILHEITTLPATISWSVSCGEITGVQISFGSGDSSAVVELAPWH